MSEVLPDVQSYRTSLVPFIILFEGHESTQRQGKLYTAMPGEEAAILAPEPSHPMT